MARGGGENEMREAHGRLRCKRKTRNKKINDAGLNKKKRRNKTNNDRELRRGETLAVVNVCYIYVRAFFRVDTYNGRER